MPKAKGRRVVDRGTVAERTCLVCGKTFASVSIGNRVCSGCKDSQSSVPLFAWNNGVVRL